MTKIINLFAGPGTGKSTTAAGVFHGLKRLGVNAELVQEYAKDKAWEFEQFKGLETPLVFQCQEYLFAQQMFRMRRLVGSADVVVTDAPILMGIAYIDTDFDLPSLKNVISEAHHLFDNHNFFLIREKAYNPRGRIHTENQAVEMDRKIRNMLEEQRVKYEAIAADGATVDKILLRLGFD